MFVEKFEGVSDEKLKLALNFGVMWHTPRLNQSLQASSCRYSTNQHENKKNIVHHIQGTSLKSSSKIAHVA